MEVLILSWLIGISVRMISVPYHLLYPAILVLCAIGVFSLDNSAFDEHLMAMFGLLGYVFAKLECEPAPMLLGFLLGPMTEEYLRRAMLLSRGDPMTFLTRPISATMLALAVVALFLVLSPAFRKTREGPSRKAIECRVNGAPVPLPGIMPAHA